MEIEVGSAVATREYKGEMIYFCSPSCVQSFDAEPARYVG
jgi:YHS domain-containing protein